MIVWLHGGHVETQERSLNLKTSPGDLVSPRANIHSRRPTRFILPSIAFEPTPPPVTECALLSEPRLLHNRLAERMRWTDWKTGVSLAARASFVPEATRELLSPCWCVLLVLSSVLCHATTGKQSSIDQVVTTGRRRCADMPFPRNRNSALQCGYWIKLVSGRAICAVVPCTMHQSQNRLAGRSRLDANLAELLPFETSCMLSRAWSF